MLQNHDRIIRQKVSENPKLLIFDPLEKKFPFSFFLALKMKLAESGFWNWNIQLSEKQALKTIFQNEMVISDNDKNED